MISKHIAVIGAGPSGLTAIKQCLDYGHKVTCFEKTESVGGLWRYHHEDIDGVASVTKTTIINTSKELSAFSDFPPPDQFPNFMHNRYMLKYFELYAKRYNLIDHVKFNHEIQWITKADDYETTGRWSVKYKVNDNELEEVFDGVMICTGHHARPHFPKFPGQEKFQGKIIHSHSYKNAEKFLDQTVVVVGVGNSGLDVAVELGRVAHQVYLSTRRGTWVANRTFLKGLPYDFCINSRAIAVVASYFGNVVNYLMESLLELYFDHEKYGLKPAHKLSGQHPAIQDELANSIMSGRVRVRKNIKKFTENGVIFDETSATEVKCDAVIMATGYVIGFPFLDPSVVDIVNNRVELYKNVFNPKLSHPETLAFIGLVQPLGAIFPISEMQSRWYAGLMKGDFKLPSRDNMLKSVKEDNAARDAIFYSSPRNTIEVHWIPYMDEIAEKIGCKPNLTKLAITDPKLWYSCMFQPCVPYQYRLTGPHSWDGARQAILDLDKRLNEPLKVEQNSSPVNGTIKSH